MMSLLFTISFIEGRGIASLPLLLLLTTIDPIVNIDSYSDIYVERIRTILLVEFVLNLFFKAVIK
jgi:hypothetical protein